MAINISPVITNLATSTVLTNVAIQRQRMLAGQGGYSELTEDVGTEELDRDESGGSAWTFAMSMVAVFFGLIFLAYSAGMEAFLVKQPGYYEPQADIAKRQYHPATLVKMIEFDVCDKYKRNCLKKHKYELRLDDQSLVRVAITPESYLSHKVGEKVYLERHITDPKLHAFIAKFRQQYGIDLTWNVGLLLFVIGFTAFAMMIFSAIFKERPASE